MLGVGAASAIRDPRSSNSLIGSRNFVVFCHANNARFHRFPVGKILQHLNTKTSIGEAVKTFGTKFWKFFHKGSFFPKNAKLPQHFRVFIATSGRQTPQWLQIARNSRPHGSPTGCLVSIFTVRINLNFFPWAVRCAQEAHPKHFRDFRNYV